MQYRYLIIAYASTSCDAIALPPDSSENLCMPFLLCHKYTHTHTCIVLHGLTHCRLLPFIDIYFEMHLHISFFIFFSYFRDISAHGVYYIPFNKYIGEVCQKFNLFVTCQPTGPSLPPSYSLHIKLCVK